MDKKRRGSTEIMALFIFSIILTTATAVLSLVSTDYKMKIKSSNAIQNLYESDSGLNMVYNSITKNCDSAVVYAKSKIYGKYNGLDKIDYAVINDDFKKYFIEFLSQKVKLDDDDFDSPKITSIAKGIENLSYYQPSSEDTSSEKLGEFKNYKLIYTDDNKSLLSSYTPEKKTFKITLVDQEGNDNSHNVIVDEANNRIVVRVKSEFYSSAGENIIGIAKSKKKIKTKYIINAPEYIDAVGEDNSEVLHNFQVQKGIYIDKNLEIKDINLTVKGQVWVNGAENKSKKIDDKYNNGISVENGILTSEAISGSSEPTHISTNATLHLFDNGHANIKNGNIYAVNVYLGEYSNYIGNYGGNTLEASKDVITVNDMGIDSGDKSIEHINQNGNSAIDIDGSFYGVGDKIEASEKTDAMNYSSSIIVNYVAKDDSKYKVDIKGDCYIGGVAYVDTLGDTFYRTGESISIISNYKAYSDRLEDEKNKEYEFKEYEDKDGNQKVKFLDISGKGANDEVANKAKHFVEYFREGYEDPLGNNIRIGGKINMLGAGVVNNGKKSVIYDDSQKEDREKVLNKKKEDFYVYAHGMGDPAFINDRDYENKPSKTVADKVDFSKLDYQEYSKLLTADNSCGYAVIGDKDHKITINDGSVEVGGKTIDVNVEKLDKKYEDNMKVSKLLIITSGDVEIIGEQKIYGCLIAGGNVTVTKKLGEEDGKTVQLIQDQEVINSIISDARTRENSIQDAFKGVFLKDYQSDGNKTNMPTNKLSYSDKGWYDSKTYLTSGLWVLYGDEGKVKS